MKKVIIYTYFSSPSSDYNLRFFVDREISYKENTDYIIVINGYYHSNNICFPELKNVTVIRRENKGFDFGGHSCALNYIHEQNKTYDYYFFMNSCVIGPIVPHFLPKSYNWTDAFIQKLNERVKLVGTTIVCLPPWDEGGPGPRVEGFFFAVDSVGLALLENEKTIFSENETKRLTILNGEYAMSKCMFKHGYSIDCMLPRYQGIDWRDGKNHHLNDCIHPSRHHSYFGTSINPYDVIFHKWFWHNSDTVNFEIVKEHVDTFYELKNI